MVLRADSFKHYMAVFNTGIRQLYPQAIPNAEAWSFLAGNVPLFECPDPDLERTYYFRWWTYRKHIRATPTGFVITEFLPPVPWAGKYNTIDCAAGHHLYKGVGCMIQSIWMIIPRSGSATAATRSVTAFGRRTPFIIDFGDG